MPIINVSQLVQVTTRDQALAMLIEVLQGYGFESTSWQSGSIQRTLIEMAAEIWSELSGTVASIARGGFNVLATGTALTQFSDSVYDNQRIAASPTRGEMVLTETDGGGPYVFAIGDVVSVESSTGITYRNSTGGNLNPSSSLTLEWAAEIGGSDANIKPDSTLSLQTTIAGVEVTNPVIGTTGTWITAYGQDEETDARLRLRNQTKWPSQSQARPEDALIFLALEATAPNGQSTGISKALVNSNNPQGPGSVDIYIANDVTPASPAQVANVDLYMQARRSTSSILRTLAANPLPITIEGTVYYRAGSDLSSVGAAVQTAVEGIIAPLPLEGVEYKPSDRGLALSELSGVITAVDNVLNVVLTNPPGDVTLKGTFGLLILASDVWNAGGTGTLTFTDI